MWDWDQLGGQSTAGVFGFWLLNKMGYWRTALRVQIRSIALRVL